MANEHIKTVAGNWYSLTCTAAATVTAEIDGESVTLATLGEGGTAVICSPSATISVETEGKYRLLPTKAPAAAGVSNSGGGATQEQIATALQAALYEPLPEVSRTIEGTGNAALHWFQLDARRVPAGRLQGISIPCRTSASTGVAQSPLYLVVWEQTEDGAEWTVLGSSTEAVQQVIGTTSSWTFDNIELSGRAIRICAATEPDVWQDTQWLGVRMAAGESGEESKGVGSSNVNQVVDLTFETAELVPKFATKSGLEDHVDDATVHVSAEERSSWNSTATSLSSHTDNTVIHITAEDRILLDEAATNFADFSHHTHDAFAHLEYLEREWLDAMLSGNQEIVVPALTFKSTEGNNLMVVRGNMSNVTATCNALTFNVPKFWVTGDYPALYSYNASTGVTKTWFAATQDSASLAPLGLTEPGVYAGDASVPLFLRGSELRWQGAPLDMAGLAELLARKDELLALLA